MRVKRLIAMLLVIQLCVSLCPVGQMRSVHAEAADTQVDENAVVLTEVGGANSYADYLSRYASGRGQNDDQSINIVSSAEDAANLGANVTLEQDGVLLFDKGQAFADFTVDVEKSGFYRIVLDYAQTEETNKAIRFGLLIDNEYPFNEAKEITAPRIFADRGEIRVDSVGNEITPKQAQVLDIQSNVLKNTNGYYDSDYLFYFENGQHVVTIIGGDVQFRLSGLRLIGERAVTTYSDYLANHAAQDTSGLLIKHQAEDAYQKSDSVLYPNYDRVNAATEDQNGSLNDSKYIRINTIGGSLWKTPGQWISWKVNVPEDGYYNLGMKFRQNFLDGLFVSRDIFIDGEILFEELQGVKFNYDDVWQTMTLADANGEELKIFLTAGEHEIRMEVTMGDFADTLRTLNDCIFDVNDLYRRIIMITSTNPDSYTDYFLTERIPDLLDVMAQSRDTLQNQIDSIIAISGGKGSKTSTLDTLRVQLGLFLEDPEEITLRLSSFKDNISAVGSWLVDIQSQALQLDYLYLKSPDVKKPDAETGLVQNTVFTFKRFLASFDTTTSVLSGEGDAAAPRVKVWLSGSGRDQAQVLKDLIDESFTPETGIIVDLELVQGSLIEATLAGMGPDVALLVGEDQPVNFAIRGALYDLSRFDDFEQVTERFYDAAVEPFWYNGGCYALPDTQVFNMLFYRTDVFEDLGITAPDTWADFYDLLPIIQRNNLQITVQDLFATLYFQQGGSYYNEAGTRSLLDSEVAINAMEAYTDLYTTYGFEVKTDFYSRFRSGELVMSIQPYNVYNQLTVAAPEISGLWEMLPIPGTPMADGTVNRAQNTTVTGSIMLESAKNKDAAWEFMKWWSRADTKASYGISLEGLMGPSARFTPANIDTMALLPWSNDELDGLMQAMALCVGIPQLPGSYYTARGLTNAFRTIVYNDEMPQSVMKLQTRYINEEITRKREEFGLTTYEEVAHEQ